MKRIKPTVPPSRPMPCISAGSSERLSKPCAMGPPKEVFAPDLCIHWWSIVHSAKASTRSWSRVTHRPGPSWAPTMEAHAWGESITAVRALEEDVLERKSKGAGGSVASLPAAAAT